MIEEPTTRDLKKALLRYSNACFILRAFVKDDPIKAIAVTGLTRKALEVLTDKVARAEIERRRAKRELHRVAEEVAIRGGGEL